MTSISIKPKILVFVGYYLPGYKAGGPLRTIANMVEHLGQDFDFWIVTRDRDQGDIDSYVNVPIGRWVSLGKAHVYYCHSQQHTISGFAKIINKTPHDVLYLNSFFDPLYTLKPLLARFLGKLPNKPLLLAPRGEFSKGAIKLKQLKKKIYIRLSRLLGMYNGILWHASSEHEAEDIQRMFPHLKDTILIALDLPAKIVAISSEVNLHHLSGMNDDSVLRIIFLSRISPKKNLDFALKILGKVSCNVIFDIYGPLEDITYWEKCLTMIQALRHNIKTEYRGVVLPDDIGATFASYDLFLFPTHGENYGHVIAEALTVGTSVLLSDQTPWRNLRREQLGWDLSLEYINEFVSVIESCALKSQDEKIEIRSAVQMKIIEILTQPEVLEANKQLFYKSIHS